MHIKASVGPDERAHDTAIFPEIRLLLSLGKKRRGHTRHLACWGKKGLLLSLRTQNWGFLECYCQDGMGPLLELTLELTSQVKCGLCVLPFCGYLLGL